MRTLTEVFAPGAPTLPEGLRTLAVSPERELEPGVTVRATFTFRNQGGAPATGVRVRFNLPEGLVYLVGSGMLDGAVLDDEQGNSPLLARAGAQIGDVAPGEERRLEISYSVAGAIENGSAVELQAAVAAFELPPVGSNVVRLVARSKPALENALTSVGIETRHDAQPGSEATVTVRVHNAGESSAHDVAVVAPIPDHTTYVAHSAQINGRDAERHLGTAFDRISAPVIAPLLPASATATLTYRVRIDAPLPDGTSIVARAQIASQETAPFSPQAAALRVCAAPDFTDDRTSFATDPAHDVAPGDRMTLRVRAANSGAAAAGGVTVALSLAEGLLPVRASARLDGRPLRDRKKETLSYDLGTIGAGQTVDLAVDAIVASPQPDGAVLTVGAVLSWDGGERRFDRNLTVRAQPHFAARNARIERIGPLTAKPGDECEASIVASNDGSTAATDVLLSLRPDDGFEDVRIFEKNARLTLDGQTVELGTLEAYAARRFTVRARVRSPLADHTEMTLAASLHCQELGEVALGQAQWRVESRAQFGAERSTLQLASDEVLRPNQLADAYLRLHNEGTDVARDVRVRLFISAEARLESVEGATREKAVLHFGEIAPGATAEARLGLRLLRSLAKEYPVTVDAVASAAGLLPVQLTTLTIATAAEPNFAVGTMHAEPADVVDVGEIVEFTLHVRNGGDGPAHRVAITVDPLESLIYVPNSTTVNDVPVRDVGAHSPLAGEHGILLSDVDSGVEAAIRWREVVHNGLAAGEAIVRVARIRYDGERVDEIASHELKVRAAPAFATTIPGLPFGVDGMIGPAFAGSARALPPAEDRFVELPPATPVSASAMAATAQALAGVDMLSLSAAEELPGDDAIGAVLAFSAERLERTLRLLEEARFGGLVPHLFAIRAFLPERIGDGEAAWIDQEREVLRDVLDRLFIKLRLPGYAIAPRDLETPTGRATLERFLERASVARGMPERNGAHRTLHGRLSADALDEARRIVRQAPIATAAPWRALATCLPADEAEMRSYVAALTAAFDELVELDADRFVDVIRHGPQPQLDEALDAVRNRLVSV